MCCCNSCCDREFIPWLWLDSELNTGGGGKPWSGLRPPWTITTAGSFIRGESRSIWDSCKKLKLGSGVGCFSALGTGTAGCGAATGAAEIWCGGKLFSLVGKVGIGPAAAWGRDSAGTAEWWPSRRAASLSSSIACPFTGLMFCWVASGAWADSGACSLSSTASCVSSTSSLSSSWLASIKFV